MREIQFLEPAIISIISERRVHPPYGMDGGQAGTKGVNLLKKRTGEVVTLPHRVVMNIQKGESIGVGKEKRGFKVKYVLII